MTDCIEKKKETNSKKRLFGEQKMRKAKGHQNEEENGKIEVVDLMFFKKPSSESIQKWKHDSQSNAFNESLASEGTYPLKIQETVNRFLFAEFLRLNLNRYTERD